MKIPARWLLFGASALLLALALAHLLQRVMQPIAPAQSAAAQQQRLQAQRLELRRELDRDRASIVARMQRLQQEGDHVAAMQLASRFHLVQDPELLALYRQSAEIEARRQRLAEIRKLLAALCTPDTAWDSANEALHDLGAPSASTPQQKDALQLTRLKASDALPLIMAQLSGQKSAVTLKHDDPNAPAGHEHHLQVHPDYAIALRTGEAQDDLVCAWRLTARQRSTRKQNPLELVFWLAPLPSGKDIEVEALRYTPSS